MAKSAWSLVYPDKKEKIKKYFQLKDLPGDMFIRIYETDTCTQFSQRLQISGNDIGFHSIIIRSDSMEEEIKKDFPFIQTYKKISL